MNEYITPKDFERGAKPAKEFNECTERLIREAQYELINEAQLRRDRDWSALNSQVVGAEVDYNFK